MEKIRNYIDRFFKSKHSLTTDDMIAFIKEFQRAYGNGLFYAVASLFRYGYQNPCIKISHRSRKRGGKS